jgi:hypothetical protein
MATSIQSESISCLYRLKGKWHSHCPILGISVNRASTLFWLLGKIIIKGLGCRDIQSNYFLPLLATMSAVTSPPSSKNEVQQSVNNVCSCILYKQSAE